jgi:hypothetical protein
LPFAIQRIRERAVAKWHLFAARVRLTVVTSSEASERERHGKGTEQPTLISHADRCPPHPGAFITD